MFEAQVAYYLNKYLGQYVEDIDGRSLAISIYEGNVVLKNLRLKPEALAQLDLPVTVKAGLLGSLTLKVPWSSLGRVPVDVAIDRLYILAAPREQEAGCTAAVTPEDVEAAFQAAKLRRVARQEADWIDDLQAAQKKKDKADAAADAAAAAGGGSGFLRGLIDTIVGNLQLSLTNVHVRYEDAETYPGQPFACGVTLERLSAATVDETGRPAFVTTSPLDLLRKALLLRRIAVYFDCGQGAWDPGAPWHDLPPEAWGDWFQPGVALDGSITKTDSTGAQKRQYMLHPVDGRALYTRRGRNARGGDADPAAEFEFTLDAVALSLSQPQYHSYSLLLAEVSTFTARLPQMGYRPTARPAPGGAARVWWRFAGLAVRQQLQARRMSWPEILKAGRLRRRYIPAYVRLISARDKPQQAQQAAVSAASGGAETSEDDSVEALEAKIAEMDAQLPEPTILMFRRLAYAEVERERRRAAKAAAAAGQAQKAQTAQGWVGWLMGYRSSGGGGGGGGAEPELTPAAEEAKGAERAELSEDEYNRLIELVSQQEEGLKLGIETPYSLLTRVTVRVGSASAVLRSASGDTVLRGALEGIAAAADVYPVTRRLQLSVTAMGVDGPDGVFLQTGAEVGAGAGDTAPTMERAASMTAERSAVTSGQALAVSIAQRPQDDSADAVVDAVLTPSYVYYSASTVQRVVQFFTPPRELRALDFSGLSAAASSQLDRARRAAAEYAAAALSEKPRLRLRLDLEAPKVAIPVSDGLGEVSLALDLGRFIIETDPATAAALPPEEAGLYECIKLTGSNVSAYAVDGAFDWAAASGGGGNGSGGGSGKLIPLLERCGMQVGLQAARYPDPAYPSLRLSPTVPTLRLHFSPGRIGRLLRVINGALPSSQPSAEPEAAVEGGSPGVGTPGPLGLPSSPGSGAEGDGEAWRARADLEGPVKVLTWTGLGRTTATWCPRHAVLYQGKLYLYERPDRGARVAATFTVSADRWVGPVPPQFVGDCTNVVTVRSGGRGDLSRVAEDSAALVLRCETAAAADEWIRAITSSQAAIQGAMASATAAEGLEWDLASSTVSSSDAEEAAMAAGRPEAEPAPEEAQRPAVLLQIDAVLGEFAVYVSGREPGSYWPPPAAPGGGSPPGKTVGAVPTEDLSGGCVSPYTVQPEALEAGEVDGEVPLIVLRASGGSLSFQYASYGLTIHTALRSLEILDVLVGRKDPERCFLAASSPPGAGAVEVGDDVFFDPGASGPLELSRSMSGMSATSSAGGAGDTPRRGGGSGPGTPRGHSGGDLAEFTLRIRRAGTAEYEGVDTSLDVALNSLYFYCNRPTVAALISMGSDVSAAASAAFGSDSSPPGPSEDVDTGVDQPSEGAEGAVLSPEAVLSPSGAAAAGAAAPEVLEHLALAAAPGGGRRTLFAMSVTLRTLQVVLHYEGVGAGAGSLAEARISDFSFTLGIAPDGGMDIASALGDLSAVDCTLSEDHPYRQACGLRPGSAASLVSLAFSSHPPSHRDARVPPGFAFYTLSAKLNELRLVFLYRFLQENLLYLSTMLAMRPAALTAVESAQAAAGPPTPAFHTPMGATPSMTTPATRQSAPREQQRPVEAAPSQQQQPFVLAMKVEMNAPVISMPRSSNSTDAIEVDLGVLRLTTGVEATVMGADGAAVSSGLVEAAQLTFSGVGCTVVQAGRRGNSVVKNPEQGWSLGWRRPLLPLQRGDVPYFDLSLDVPFIKASLTDAEYLLMTSVASDNVSEAPTLPPGAQWIADRYAPAAVEAQDAALMPAAAAEPETPSSPRRLLRTLSPAFEDLSISKTQPRDSPGSPKAPAPASPAPTTPSTDVGKTRIRTVVSLGEVELELRQSVEGLPAPVPLARFSVADLYVAYHNTEGGAARVQVCVPKVEAQDLRPDVPVGQSLAISSGHKASFLMLDWQATPGFTSQTLGLTLQKPLFVAELSFLLSVARFVVPNFSFVKSSPIPFASHDILLGAGPGGGGEGSTHVTTEDAWLSPGCRLLADTPGLTAAEYDGAGHRLILPDKDHLDELLPLILVGPGVTLRLRNVTLINADSLAACLQLAPGARLLVAPADGVRLVDSRAAGAAGASPPLSPRGAGSPPAEALRRLSLGARPPAEGTEPVAPVTPAPQQAQQDTRSLKISVSAVGLGLQLMQLDTPQQAQQGGIRRAGSSVAGGLARASSAHPSTPEMAVIAPTSAGAPAAPTTSLDSASSVRRAGSSTPGALSTPSKPRSVRLLAATMDVAAEYESEALRQRGRIEVQGLRAETRTVEDLDRVLTERAASDLVSHKKVRGKKECVILQPCQLSVDFDLRSEACPRTGLPQVTQTSVDLRSTELRVTLSPVVAELAASLGAGALAPLRQPGPAAPLLAVRQFERVWSLDPDAAWQQHAELAVSLSVTGASAGVTVWHPQAPPGYGITGHVITAADATPSFEVMTVAVNSGLAAYPASFERSWAGGGAVVWRPVPPEGYVAVGDLVTSGEPPELSDVLCLHASALVEAPVGECFPLPPAAAAVPAAAAAAADIPPVDFWCVDNSMGTFMAATAGSIGRVQGRDLRSPAGLTPAALIAHGFATPAAEVSRTTSTTNMKASEPAEQRQAVVSRLQLTSTPRQLFSVFQASRRQKRTEEVRRSLTPAVVDFRRIWCDQGAFSGGEGVAFWRPVAPPGYAALGDCAARGFVPPTSCLVVREEWTGDAGRGQPLVKSPLDFELIWADANPREEQRLCLWRPVPPEGYVAMGCVASVGLNPPRRGIKCLRRDAAAPGDAPRTPMWAVRATDASIPPLSVWTVDEGLGTFVVDPTDSYNPVPLQKWRIKVTDATAGAADPGSGVSARSGASGAAHGASSSTSEATPGEALARQKAAARQGVDVIANIGGVSVLLLDALQTPVVEVEMRGIEAGVKGPSSTVVQAYLGLRPAVTAYNRGLRHWEPILEPVDVIAKCDANLGRAISNGIEPGVHINVKSSAEMVYTTLAAAHASAVLAAADQWRAAQDEPRAAAASAISSIMGSEASAVPTTVINALGVDAALELDYGDRMGLAKLPAGQAAPVLRPLQRYPRRRTTTPLTREALPHDLVLVDIAAATGVGLRAGQSLFCAARLEGLGIDGAAAPSAGVSSGPRTRAVSVSSDKAPASTAEAQWGERLVLLLPSRPSPSHRLSLELWDANGAGGAGARLGSGEIEVPVASLGEREPQELEMSISNGRGDGAAVLCVLRLSYMLQRPWRVRLEAGASSETDAWYQEESTAGQRALSLASRPGIWAVVPSSGEARASLTAALTAPLDTSAASGKARLSAATRNVSYSIPLRVGDEGVVIEGRLQNGRFQELLRAPCQVVNTTAFTLEACLIVLEDSDWAEAVPLDKPPAAIASRNVLGRAAPGEALPLPLEWRQTGRQLMIRPVVPEVEDEDGGHGFDAVTAPALHDWSVGASGGWHTVRMDDLDEGITRLVSCAPLAALGGGGGGDAPPAESLNTAGAAATSAAPSVSTLWFSIQVESDILSSGTKRGAPLEDWRVVVAPPLTLSNQLPLPGGLIVWEHLPGAQKGEAVAKLSRRVPSGADVAVHTVDLRRPVSMTLYPDGYDWADPSPALLSAGFARTARPPPDRFRLVRPGSKLPVEVFLKRDYQAGAWALLGSEAGRGGAAKGGAAGTGQPEFDAGALVARGVPLAVTLLAPLWVVNATGLAIDAAVVAVAPPASTKSKGFGRSAAALASAAAATPQTVTRVLRTSNIPIPGMPPPQEPAGRRTIAPASMELLSFPLPTAMLSTSGAGTSSSAASSSASATSAAPRNYYGVRLRVAGSGWTQPLTVDALDPGTGGGAPSGAVETLQNAQPVLIQAEAREYSAVFEVVARLEVTAFRNSQVLRLEPHVVVTNRTGLPVQLLQCHAAGGPPVSAATSPLHAGVAAAAARASPAIVVPEGASMAVGGGEGEPERAPTLVRPLPRALSDSYTAGGGGDSLWKDSEDSDGEEVTSKREIIIQTPSQQQQQSWKRAPSMLRTPAMVSLRRPSSSPSGAIPQGATGVINLPAGAVAMPLHLLQGLARKHVLCFRCGSGGGDGGSGEEANLLWSRPLTVSPEREEEHTVAIPVTASSAAERPGGLPAAGVALLRMSVLTRGPGTLHVVLESANSDPPYALENRTFFPLRYRQSGLSSAPFHTLPPFSAVGYVWEYTLKEGAPELEVQEALGVAAPAIYSLTTAEGRARPLPLSAAPHQCTVRLGYAETVASDAAGVVAIGGDAAGGALGRGGVDKVVQIAPGRDPAVLAGLKGVGAPPPEVRAVATIPGLELSIVDEAPQEVLLLTVGELSVAAARGVAPSGPFKWIRVSVRRLQADNQMPGARFPVALAAAKHATGALPMISGAAVAQAAGARGRTFFPYLGARAPETLQVAITEPLVWRLAAMATRLADTRAAAGGAVAATAAADLPVRIRHLSFADIAANVSFQGDPLSRPRHLAGGVVSMVIDLANFQAAPVTLRGFDRVEVRTMRSAVVSFLYQWISGELFSIALSLVRSFGVIGGASRVLGAMAAGLAKLSGDLKKEPSGPLPATAPSAAQPRLTTQLSSRAISDVGDGLLEGAGAFGSSIMRGFKGLVEKPVRGAKEAGMGGAMKGACKGLVGAFTAPMTGMLDALSATAEGVDASMGAKARESALVMSRRRLPRVVGGDGKLTPLLRDGSDRESVIEQLGAALLRATLLANPKAAAAGVRGAPALEAYEEHFVLPNEAVALLTNRSLILVAAPGFAQLNGAAEVGALTAADVSPGELQWAVRWDDVLALELRWSTAAAGAAGRYPDRVVVHRRGTPGVVEAAPLARALACFPGTPQASQLKLVAQKVLRKYYQDPARRDAAWAERHAARAALPADQPPDQLPLTLPSLDFVPTWHTNPSRPPVVHFWRPVAPPGYHAAGDVATLGPEAPLQPVPCFRDDETLRTAVKAALASSDPDAGEDTEPVAAPPASRPPTARPLEYTLIWRYNGERSVSMWMPVAPSGYVAMGAVVMGAAEVPSLDDYLCVREDLTESARVFDSPIWAYDPAPAPLATGGAAAGGGAGSGAPVPAPSAAPGFLPETWKVTVWPVDSRLGTFLVVRALGRPPPEVARSVAEVEARPQR